MTGPHKYNARKVEVDGHTFDSAAEARRYGELKLLERAGEIVQLRLQPEFKLWGRMGSVVAKYRADFAYIEMKNGEYVRDVVEDVKGVKTPVYRLKAKLFKDNYGFDITETGKGART